jgi:hypothetical protein
MKLILPTFILLLIFSTCKSGNDFGTSAQTPDGVHKVTVKEVQQTSGYTYLLVTENATDTWLALPKMTAEPGEIYYYRNGFKMTDFESKELNRKFEEVYFLESISKTPEMSPGDPMANPHQNLPAAQSDTSKSAEYKANVVVKKEAIEPIASGNGITIAQLYATPEKFEGKTIQIQGKVTKFSTKIMSRNWIHLQDGTESAGKFDLTATTTEEASVGQTITLEGKVALNKDFGYGYKYAVLLEDARILEKK